MATIVVTGVGGQAGQSVAALLTERQHRVVGVDMRPLPSRAYPVIQVPAAGAPDFLPALYAVSAQAHCDLVIPTVSAELPVLACAWHLGAGFPVVVSSGQAVDTANDKYLTALALAAAGVAVPRFALPSQLSSPQALAERIGWPCISKPRVGRGGPQVRLHTEAEWTFVAALSDRFILQEYDAGLDYAPNVFVDPQGKATVVTLEKSELPEGPGGSSVQVRQVEAPDVADLAAAAAKALRLVGPLAMGIRRRADGQPAVLEVTARFGANIGHAPEILDLALATFLGPP